MHLSLRCVLSTTLKCSYVICSKWSDHEITLALFLPVHGCLRICPILDDSTPYDLLDVKAMSMTKIMSHHRPGINTSVFINIDNIESQCHYCNAGFCVIVQYQLSWWQTYMKASGKKAAPVAHLHAIHVCTVYLPTEQLSLERMGRGPQTQNSVHVLHPWCMQTCVSHRKCKTDAIRFVIWQMEAHIL